MNKYVLNKVHHANGDHEVHTMNCYYLPSNYVDLGYQHNCQDVVRYTRSLYPNIRIDGCAFCSRECHTS